jgi:transposase
MNFKRGIDSNQVFLLPKKPSEFLPDDHLAKVVYEVVDLLNISNIESKYSELGQNAFNPRMMIRDIFYGYSTSVRSSRKISKGCEDRFDFNYLSDGLKPSHDRISDFRKDNLEELKQLFQEIVLIGTNLGIAKLGNIKTSIDGTKVKANASAKLSKDEDGLKKLLDKTREEIDKMFEEAEHIDDEEDRKYGKENRGDELPEKLRNKKSREKAIKEAYEKLKRQKEEMKAKIMRKKNREPTEAELKKIEKKKINITDNDAKFMKQRNGIIKPSYNAQASVDEENQFILANDVTDQCNDQHQLVPMLEQTEKNIGERPKQAKADNGYHPQIDKAREMFPEIDLYVDDKNRRNEYINFHELKKKYSKEEYNNLMKIVSPEGEEKYKKRMHTVEPVFGNLKHNLGYRDLLLRGLSKAKGEFNLMCIGHNLKKIATFLTKSKNNLARALRDIEKTKKIEMNVGISNRICVNC